MSKKRFKRQEWWKYKRLRNRLSWRRPRGSKNPMRRKVWGRPPLPEVGYRKPRKIRGLHPSGLAEALVHNVRELEELDPKKYIARIAGGVGARKREEIIKRAKELGIRVVQA